MPTNEIIVGLDIGTSLTKVAIGKRLRDDKTPSIIALGVAPSEGVRRGVVIDIQDATHSISQALEYASKMVEEDIKEVYISINGAYIKSYLTSDKVAVSRLDGDVTKEDVNRVISNANPGPSSQNKEVIDIIPKTYALDEETGIKNPIGMNGIRLEVEALIVENNSSSMKNLEKCIHNLGLKVDSQEIGIVASANSVLTKKQKDLGVAVIDLGAGTTSIVVYEEGHIIHIGVIPIGANHITNDLAIGLRTSIEVAEKIKLKYGVALEKALGETAKLKIDLAKIDPEEEGVFPVAYIASIIEARSKEIFELITQELKTIERDGLLPAGILLVGGGANLKVIADLAKQELKLPVKIGTPQGVEGSIADVDNPIYANLVGLIKLQFHNIEHNQDARDNNMSNTIKQSSSKIFSPIKKLLKMVFPD
ncbi:MAG: cell division protein FtsA [Candidatus Paceibacterota bacterium]